MKLFLFLYKLLFGLPNLDTDLEPTGLQLNGNVKAVQKSHDGRPGPGAWY